MNWHTNLIVNDQRYTFIDLAKVAADLSNPNVSFCKTSLVFQRS